ncbi:MAG TPA: FlgD immunoglobulin-like domain containing protein [Spirochaetota bacterium]|nr:MAG: flagellar basal body rod modification protein [Spirochaetes bacterium ADurb.Bin133]HNZ25863.1 FlgD immunoglobulin-like domain containing protein [Spirochaetota bacterium]
MKKRLCVFLIMILVSNFSYGIFRSPEVGRFLYWMYSPNLLSRGMGFGGTDTPSGIIINPASNAFVQRFKIDFSFGFSPSFWSGYNTYKYRDETVPTNVYNRTEDFLTAIDFFIPFNVNAGVVIPSKYGNFTIYANYFNMSNLSFGLSNNNDLLLGKYGSLYFSFSKDYNDSFAFGASGNVKFSYNPDSKYVNNKFDVGGGFDFGFIFRPEWVLYFNKKKAPGWGFQDFEFSIIVKDIAKPLINSVDGVNGDNDLYWYPAPFTPNFGMSFNLYNDGSTYWKWLIDSGFPFFQNLTLSLGTEIQIYKFLVLRGSYTFDLEGVLEYAGVINMYEYLYNIANASFGLSFKFSSNFAKKQTKEEAYANRHKTTEFSIDLGAKPYHNGFIFQLGCTITIGTKDVTPPDITYYQNVGYFSPNFDGVQDNLIIDLNIKDDRYVIYWKLEVLDADNKVVKTIESKEQRAETMKFKDVLKKYFSPKSGILIPKKVIWDGKDNNGNIVPDGLYYFKFYAMDDNKNIDLNGSKVGTVYIDTQKPYIESKVENVIFSPNEDGNKDFLIIDLDIIRKEVVEEFIHINPTVLDQKVYEISEKEIPQTINSEATSDLDVNKTNVEKKQIWIVDIIDSQEKIVKTYKYEEKGKQRIEWDGKDENGNKLPDGVYKIKLHSIDLAGNYWEKFITNIIINTEPTPIQIKTLSGIFSPNDDGIKDKIGFKFEIPNKNGIDRWDFEILDKADKPVKKFVGAGLTPDSIEWDGKTTANSYAKEGFYRGKLTIYYVNGNTPSSITPEFELDVTPPSGKVDIQEKIFSPDGDGVLDEAVIKQTASSEDEWNGKIFDSENKVVKSYLWRGQPPKQFNWDGVDDNNNLLPDGSYFYQLSSRDVAGNYFETPKKEVKIFTANTPVFITASLSHISPNGDNIKDNQIFQIRSTESKENRPTNWSITIKDDKDSVVFTEKNEGSLPPTYTWNGKNNSQSNAIDGDYYGLLEVNFESGTKSSSKSKLFTIDTVKPSIELKLVGSVFSPNGDSRLDVIEILQKGSEEDLWESYIYDKDKKELLKKYYKGRPVEKEIWDGKDSNNNLSPNGFYSYLIKSVDKAGNSNFAEINNIELKNINTPLFLTLSDDKFSPNLDGKYDTLDLKPILGVKDDLEVYKIEIFNSDKKIVRKFEGLKSIPDRITWDGLDNSGVVVPDGGYYAKLSAIYRFGNNPEVESAQFLVDNTPPNIELTMSPQYFSPDNDGADDELTMSIKSYDLTGIKDWTLSIMNPAKTKVFNSFSGTGKPTELIIWDGVGKNGELVESAEDYPLLLRAEDVVGNVISKELDPIMVDILVEKLDDGRLKIKISNIEFKPESSEMTDSDKNGKILELLSKALKKYNLYNITIEGHANRFITGRFNEEYARKLSKDRAEFIANSLSKKGIQLKRITTEGKGGDDPIFIPVEDGREYTKEELDDIKDKKGKNRRVEFYLQK